MTHESTVTGRERLVDSARDATFHKFRAQLRVYLGGGGGGAGAKKKKREKRGGRKKKKKKNKKKK